MPVTIFVTAYDRYALRAFDANAVDYLLKPFGKERFERALIRAKERIFGNLNCDEVRRVAASLGQIQIQQRGTERIAITENGRVHFVKARDIDWIGAEGNYARLHVGIREYELRETLTSLEGRLNPDSPVHDCERSPDQGNPALVPRTPLDIARKWSGIANEPLSTRNSPTPGAHVDFKSHSALTIPPIQVFVAVYHAVLAGQRRRLVQGQPKRIRFITGPGDTTLSRTRRTREKRATTTGGSHRDYAAFAGTADKDSLRNQPRAPIRAVSDLLDFLQLYHCESCCS
jgi:hypothetical protein